MSLISRKSSGTLAKTAHWHGSVEAGKQWVEKWLEGMKVETEIGYYYFFDICLFI